MNPVGITVQKITLADVEPASQILCQCGLCEYDEARLRLRSALSGAHTCALMAEGGGTPAGVLLACYNGFHVFLSHIAVIEPFQSRGIGSALLEEVTEFATTVNARGIITDARLSSVGFFHKHNFRLPGAVFLFRDVQQLA